MAKTYDGKTKLTVNYSVETTAPLDDRIVVNTISDLTDGSITAPYKGMVVCIAGTSDLYVLLTDGIENSKKTENWKKVSSEITIDDTNNFISIPNKDDQTIKVQYGNFGNNFENGIATTEEVRKYIKNDFEVNFSDSIKELFGDTVTVDETRNIVKFKKGEDTYFTSIKKFIAPNAPTISSSELTKVSTTSSTQVTITNTTSDTEVYYSIDDNGDPTQNGTKITNNKFNLAVDLTKESTTYTVKIASKSLENQEWSSVNTYTCITKRKIKTPVISYTPTSTSTNKTIIITCDTSDASILYKIDNSSEWVTYNKLNKITESYNVVDNETAGVTHTYKAKATAPGWVESDETLTTSINYNKVVLDKPTISIKGYDVITNSFNTFDEYATKLQVTISNGANANGATIKYGTSNDCSNTYTQPFEHTISGSTFYAKAEKSGFHTSQTTNTTSYTFGTKLIYWDAVNNTFNENNISIDNIKNKIKKKKTNFPISIKLSNVSYTTETGKAVIAYDKNYGELKDITNNSGDSMLEQFSFKTIGDYNIYIQTDASDCKDLEYNFKI